MLWSGGLDRDCDIGTARETNSAHLVHRLWLQLSVQRCFRPQSRMALMTGPRLLPFSVSTYSRRTGRSLYSTRSTRPSSSMALSRADSVLGATPGSDAWKS